LYQRSNEDQSFQVVNSTLVTKEDVVS
jgi:hypothetical protein